VVFDLVEQIFDGFELEIAGVVSSSRVHDRAVGRGGVVHNGPLVFGVDLDVPLGVDLDLDVLADGEVDLEQQVRRSARIARDEREPGALGELLDEVLRRERSDRLRSRAPARSRR
jgi:hypothetical protein